MFANSQDSAPEQLTQASCHTVTGYNSLPIQ